MTAAWQAGSMPMPTRRPRIPRASGPVAARLRRWTLRRTSRRSTRCAGSPTRPTWWCCPRRSPATSASRAATSRRTPSRWTGRSPAGSREVAEDGRDRLPGRHVRDQRGPGAALQHPGARRRPGGGRRTARSTSTTPSATASPTRVRAGPTRSRSTTDLHGFRIGLMTCYDLRFPELARLLSAAGADVLVLPAAWVAGPAQGGPVAHPAARPRDRERVLGGGRRASRARATPVTRWWWPRPARSWPRRVDEEVVAAALDLEPSAPARAATRRWRTGGCERVDILQHSTHAHTRRRWDRCPVLTRCPGDVARSRAPRRPVARPRANPPAVASRARTGARTRASAPAAPPRRRATPDRAPAAPVRPAARAPRPPAAARGRQEGVEPQVAPATSRATRPVGPPARRRRRDVAAPRLAGGCAAAPTGRRTPGCDVCSGSCCCSAVSRD